MKYRMKGGFIRGEEKVPGNSPENDTVKIHVSPGEIVLDKETISRGPKAILNFAMSEIEKHKPELMQMFKDHFDEGGTPVSLPTQAPPDSNDNYSKLQNYFNPPSPPPAPMAAPVTKTPQQRIKELEAIRTNLRPLNPAEQADYNRAKALSGDTGMAEGGMIDDNKSMANGGKIDNSITPGNAFNLYIPDQGIVGGTVYDGSTDEKFLFGEYCFDIEKAREISKKRSNAEIPVSDDWIDKIKLDPKEALKSKSKNPVFIAQIHTPNGMKPLLIDGNHRMFKAAWEGEKSIPAYVFSPEETSSLFCSKPDHMEHPKFGSINGYYQGGMVKGYSEGGTTGWDSTPPTAQELASKTPSWDATPPTDKELGVKEKPKEESSLGEKLQTGLENYGNAVTMGYLPQLQAATEPLVNKAIGAVTGTEPDDRSYVQARDENIARIAQESAANPKSAIAGTVAGVANSALATPELPFLKGATGLTAGAAKGATTGAAYGALQNPGDVEGKIDSVQAAERLKDIEHGAILGGVIGTGAAGLGKAFNAMKNSADAAQEFANTQAVRQSGAMLKDFRTINAKNQVDDLGKFALDNGIVKAGDSVDDVAEKADAARKQAGQKLDAIYGQAQDAIEQNKVARAVDVTPTSTPLIGEGAPVPPELVTRGFNPTKNKPEILKAVADRMGDSPDKATALRTVGSYLDQLADDHGDQLLDPKTANNIKTQIDRQINYSRNPLTKNPAAEQGFSAMRDYVNNAVQEHIEDLGKASGDPELAEKLRMANKDYGQAKQLQNMAEDRVSRNTANRMFGLTDTIAGAAGGAAGLAEGAAMGHPVEGALAGLAVGGLNKVARTYGPGILAGAANKAAPILEKTAVPLGNALSKIPVGVSRQALTELMTENRPKMSSYGGNP